MYMSGSVLLIELHPEANTMIEMLEKMGGDLPGDIEKGARIYKEYGTISLEPVNRNRVAQNDSVFVHVEGNIFICHKSRNNKFIPGDEIYILNSEIEEVSDGK